MADNSRKIFNQKAAKIILCAALYIALILFTGSLFLLSANYQNVYESPTVSGGKADFKGIDISSRSVPCTLTGEWEFFYNRWIVTDGDDGQADGMINLPALWTDRDFGNGKLPKYGYASYRLVLENVQPDIYITVFRHNSDVAYRVFINGQLNVRSGTVSKNIRETKVSGRYDQKIAFHTDGNPIEIVIELSACTNGGFNVSPWLNYDWSGEITYGSRLRSFTLVALGISSAAVGVSILTYMFFKYKRDITVPALMLTLFIHFICSKDIMYVFALPFTLTRIIAFFSATATFIVFIEHMRRNGVVYNKTELLVTGISAAVFTVLLFTLYGTPYAPIAALLLIITGSMHLIPLSCADKLTNAQRVLYSVFLTLILIIFIAELCDGLGLIVFGIEFYFSIVLMFIIACFTILWLWKIATAARTAVRVSELECELFSAKNKALKAQIKPHFVFNSLTAIQARYRKGLTEGDKAIEQFARHMRLITDSDSKETISFDEEVRNVLNYFELENLRAGGKLKLLLDLDFNDFSIPVLSLQPLVENVVRHGNLNAVDGYIQLSSVKKDNAAVVTVSDNGQGFDICAVHEGVGLENTRKRLELIGGKMTVISSPDCGTRVIIEIPLE